MIKTVRPADVKNGTIAWIRTHEGGEFMLAMAKDYQWLYLVGGTTRLIGSISPLSAVTEMHIVERPPNVEQEKRASEVLDEVETIIFGHEDLLDRVTGAQTVIGEFRTEQRKDLF